MRKRLLSFMMASLMLISVFGNISAYAEGEDVLTLILKDANSNRIIKEEKLDITDLKDKIVLEVKDKIVLEGVETLKIEVIIPDKLKEKFSVEVYNIKGNDEYNSDLLNIEEIQEVESLDTLEFGILKNYKPVKIYKYDIEKNYEVLFYMGANFKKDIVKSGNTVKKPEEKEFIQPVGEKTYVFKIKGWAKPDNGMFDFDTPVKSNLILRVKKDDTLTEYGLVLIDEEGKNLSFKDDSKELKVYEGYKLKDNLIPSKNKEGKTLIWYKNSNFNEKWNFENDTVTKDTTLYAKLEEQVNNPQPQPPAVIGGGAPNSSVRPDTANNANNAGETVINENAAPLAEFGDNFIARFKINSKEYSVKENDKAVSKMTDIAPMISQNRTLLPVRLTGEVLGVKADYDNATKTAKFTYMGADNKENVIEMTAGQKMMKVNGQEVALTADIMIVNGRIMLPVSDVQRALKDLGLQIELQWNHETKEVTIVKSAK